jgi:hypothetical protein
MRTLRDLDEEIERAERRLSARREHLNESLQSSRTRTRRSLASPQVLAAAFVAGFLIERLGRSAAPKSSAPQAKAAGGIAGIAAGLAAAALRAALSNPKLWESMRNAWARRAEAKIGMGYTVPAGAQGYADPAQRYPGKPDETTNIRAAELSGGMRQDTDEPGAPGGPRYGTSSATAAHR